MMRTEHDGERTRRLAEVWQDSAPTADEIGRLQVRLALRPVRAKRARGKVLIVALIQGFMFGGATLAAAAWITGHALPLFDRHADARGGALAPVTPAHRASLAPPQRHIDPQSVSGSGEVPRAAFDDAPGRVAPGREKAGDLAETRRHAPGGRAGAALPKPELAADVPPAPSVTEKPSAAPPADGPWARVAQALSASDWTSADRALVELCSASDPATRDAATLARAELWIAHGQGASFRASVERLAQTGFTPLIRRRAARLLERLPR
jgi:hypothetical protein